MMPQHVRLVGVIKEADYETVCDCCGHETVKSLVASERISLEVPSIFPDTPDDEALRIAEQEAAKWLAKECGSDWVEIIRWSEGPELLRRDRGEDEFLRQQGYPELLAVGNR